MINFNQDNVFQGLNQMRTSPRLSQTLGICKMLTLLFSLHFLFVIVKNYKGSEVLLYLQVNRLTCHSLMEAGRRYETPVSELKDFIIHSKTIARVSVCLHQFPPVSTSSTGAAQTGLDGCLDTQWVA